MSRLRNELYNSFPIDPAIEISAIKISRRLPSDDMLFCTIKTCKLEEASYVAISYTWGEAN